MRNKYNAQSEGAWHSKTERERGQELELLARAGVIADLRRQVPFAVTPPGCPARYYYADFAYRVIDPRPVVCPAGVDAGVEVVEDVKCAATETAEWRLKWHLVRWHHAQPDRVWATIYGRRRGGRMTWRSRLWAAPPNR